ncbi:unnamed protein product [Meganyctiphanes norvegica]|uniref:Hexosyltransferase n=1 Tax=Meganyctiphanes norvegica TaxID=48144 RepID=A0AAV2R0A6_MEGNR
MMDKMKMDKQQLVTDTSLCESQGSGSRNNHSSQCSRRTLEWLLLLTGSALLLTCLAWASHQNVGPPPPMTPLYRPPPRGPEQLYLTKGEVLLDLPPKPLLVNSPVCLVDKEHPLLMVIMVVSHPSHKSLRMAHRIHASAEELNTLGVRRVFLLADASQGQVGYPAVAQEEVLQEATEWRDLVVGSFTDHYRNLTYKHALALTWPTRYCKQAQYIVKADDDIMLDIWGLTYMLASGLTAHPSGSIKEVPKHLVETNLTPKGLWAAGYVQQGLVPQRGHGKWAVTPQEYPDGRYPRFLAGWAYITTQPAAIAILREAQEIPYFWIDDVHMTGVAAGRADVKRYAINHFYTLDSIIGRCCLNATRPSTTNENPTGAPLCGLLVAPSDKNPDILGAWLSKAKQCHVYGIQCESTSIRSCPHSNLGPSMVGSVIPIK